MTPKAPDGSPATEGPAERGALYSAYITFVLMLVFMLAATDRNILAILLVPVQNDLKVSDTAMGFLTGAAFSIVYAVAALPLARLADRGHRRNLIAAAVAFWSAMTAACGLAVGYWTLLLARVGVAAGEAAHQPAIMSMIGDLYPRHRRGLAVGFLTIGTSLGITGGAFLAGWLSDLYGWKFAFIALGAPGLIVAAMVMFTLPEPERGAFDGRGTAAPESFWRSVVQIAKVPTIPRLLMAKLLLQVGFGGFLVWTPAFFMRVHGMSATEMSAVFGAAAGVGAILSQVIAGVAGDYLSRRGERWRSYYCVFALLLGIPCVLMVLLGSTTVSITGLFLQSAVVAGVTSASLTAGLSVVVPQVRGVMTAAMGFCISVIGGGLGPVAFGAINEILKPEYGDTALRYTLLGVPLSWLASAVFFWLAARTTDKDVAAASTMPTAPAVFQGQGANN